MYLDAVTLADSSRCTHRQKTQINLLYLVPRAQRSPREHEQVTHGDQTGPYQKREEAQHPLEDRLNTDEDEDGQEEEESSRNCYQERQVVLCVLEADRYRKNDLLIQFYCF